VGGKQYEPEINALLNMMADRQRPDGAWSYTIPPHPTGDTSQTQYAALSTWFSEIEQYEVNSSSVAEFCNWLIRTQDPSGQFAYQGTDPGNYERQEQPSRVQQPDAAFRMSPAALGALYIAAKLLNVSIDPPQENPLLKEVKPETAVDEGLLRRAIRDGNRAYDASFKIDVLGNYQYYYLYSVERYFSLREDAEQKIDPEPRWYGEGVDYLAKTQNERGSWNDNSGSVAATSFASLFLMRATQEIIMRRGVMYAGIHLPENLSNVTVDKNGQVISTVSESGIEELLKLAGESALIDQQSVLSELDIITLRGPKKPEPSKVEQFKRIISGDTGGQNYFVRLVAVRAIANSQDITNVPTLIFALGDGDYRVVKEANDGLRLISKRLTYVDLPKRPSVEQKRTAQTRWYAWLQSVRPDLEVPDDAFLDVSATP
jgi:hypothetical protein